MPRRVDIYDTTLRDGGQGEGVSFSLEDKLRVARAFDRMGIPYIEGGWPGSNPKDEEFFAAARKEKWRQARIVAFGSTRHAKHTPARDPNLAKLLGSGVSVATIFGKSWDFHVTHALRVSLEENVDMVASSVRYLKQRIETVFFDAEHFFDGFAANPEYALSVLAAAFDGGADAAILCETNGGRLPAEVAKGTGVVVERFPGRVIGIHCHNDSGLAVANSLEAVRMGASQVQGCMNGFGERSGNADLSAVIPNLELKMGVRTIGRENLRKLTPTSRYVYQIANLPLRDNQPFVGHSAFAHKGGVHVSAVARNPKTYEHVTPDSVGNERRILVSELSGRSNILACSPVDFSKYPGKEKEVLAKVAKLENEGYAFENASASFELLLLKAVGEYRPAFELLGWRVLSDGVGDRRSEATVRIAIGDVTLHTAADAENGPVSALDQALRKALIHVYPFVNDMRLADYRVHIVDAQSATAARVRVVIESRDGRGIWGTVGVSENILEASMTALADSFHYLVHRRGGPEKAARKRRMLHHIPKS